LAARVSVLLPCHNIAEFLPDCIASLSAQTFADFEVIAVDDGSTDHTRRLLDDWGRRDARVSVIAPGRVGLVRALQLAGAAAEGDILARMDADDIARPARFQRQLDLLDRDPAVAACGTQIRYFPLDQVRDGALAYQVWINGLSSPAELARDVFVECPIAHPSLMIRRSVFDQIGGYHDRDWPEDYDLVLRLWSAGHALANVEDVLLDWRERPDRLSRSNNRYSLDAFRKCKAHYLARTLLRSHPAVIWGAGPVGKAMARQLIDHGVIVRAFIDIDPNKIGQRPIDIPVHSPDLVVHRDNAVILAAVGSADARQRIRTYLNDVGLVELQDFCAVA
jgi:glycosyltransferase involved in cell wall biosynthesis